MTYMPSPTAMNASGVTNGLKSPAAQGVPGQNGLMGFISMLMQNPVMTPAGMTNPVAGATDLAAKIAALMQQNGGKIDLAALQQMMSPEMAAAVAQQLQAQTNPIGAPTLLAETPVGAGLTSDLSGQAAGTLQDASLMQDLATQLNTLEPGAVALPETGAAPLSETPADTLATVEDDMMATLLALTGKTQDAPLVSPLAQQAASRTDALRTSTPADAMPQNAGLTPGALSGEPVVGDARGPSPSTLEAALKNAPIIVNTPATTLTAQAAQAQAQPQPQAPQNGMFNGMLGASLGTLNSLMGGGFGEGGFSSDQGFSGQGYSDGSAGYDGSTLDSAGLKTANANGASFTNYISAAAGRANAATTQMIGLQMSRNAASKIDTFTMQLEPADLGRLEVQMRFGKDGTLSAKLIADKPETLSLLQRDSAQLERVLQQSGLDLADGSLSFDLREQNQQSLYEGQGRDKQDFYAGRGDRAHKQDATMIAQVAIEAAGYVSQSGVNIMV